MLRAGRVFVGRGTCFHIQLCAPSCKTFPLHFFFLQPGTAVRCLVVFFKVFRVGRLHRTSVCLCTWGCLCVRLMLLHSHCDSLHWCSCPLCARICAEWTHVCDEQWACGLVWSWRSAPRSNRRNEGEGKNVLYIPSICLAIATACIWTVLAWRLVFKKDSLWVLDIGAHVWHDFLELILWDSHIFSLGMHRFYTDLIFCFMAENVNIVNLFLFNFVLFVENFACLELNNWNNFVAQ